MKNNTLGTVYIIFINKLQFLIFFHFSDFQNIVKCMDSMVKYESNLAVHGFCSPSHYNEGGGGGGDLVWKFAKILYWHIFFLHLWQDKPLCVKLKTNGGVMFITVLLHFHYFISLETANSQKIEVFLLRNVNASVVTCRYPQIYNFSLRKEFLETLCKCIYLGF